MRVISFDIESCNGNSKEASMCSFGYCISDENFVISEKEDILINPASERFVLSDKKRRFGIALAYPQKVFRSSPLFCEVYEHIKELIESCDLVVGFSIENDLNYLNKACEYYSLENINFSFIDVQELDVLNRGVSQKESLEKAVGNYSIDFTLHKSDDDAYATLFLLKKICEENGKTIGELLDKFNIVKGENFAEGYSNCYSLSEIKNGQGVANGLKLKKYLFFKYFRKMKKQSGVLKGKRFCFSKKLAYSDINLSRSMLSLIYALGGRYAIYPEQSDYLVFIDENDGNTVEKRIKEQRRTTCITLNDFYEIVGKPEIKDFNDEERIRSFFNKNIT